MENPSKFEPNNDLIQALVSMGISHEHACEALFCTGNDSIEAAVNYVFTNLVNDTEFSKQSVTNESEDSEEDDGGDDDNNDDCNYFKMTFVVNTSLKMGIGKIAAQVAHACLGLYRIMKEKSDPMLDDALNQWDSIGEKKIVLKGDSSEHLEMLFNDATQANIPCYLVHDAGHTQIPAGSVTVLSLFGLEDRLDLITGKLRLL